jgi:O-antigen ligase
MVLGVFVGAIQVAGGPESSAYLYSIHSAGAVGFFANQNHMATLLLVGIPMAAGLIVSTKSDRRKTSIATLGVGAALLVLILVGIGLTASRAAIILSVPVIVASATLFPKVARWRGIALAVAVLGLIGAVVIVATNPIGATTTDTMDQPSSRIEIWTTSEAAIRDNLAVGTGLGSFEKVYHRYEDPTRITHSFINHAHNDYLELVVELGAAGLLLIIAFLAWWLIAVVKIWTSTLSSPLARASTIATAAILAHSAVDFPIRTQAISAIFAACIAIMARTLSAAPAIKPGEMRPTRHVTIR